MWSRHISLPLLLLVVSYAAYTQQCPALYQRFSNKHTFCQPPNTACTILKRGVDEQDKALIVKVHNDYRSKVATGQESNAGGLPTAANMLEMVWDDELAEIAQKLAETCNYGHDCNNCRRVHAFSVGQNIGMSWGFQTPPERAEWQDLIKRLYDEVSRFDKSKVNPYVPGPLSGDKVYGHFTQVAWASSWKIGCGWTVYNTGSASGSLKVCNYGPAGNMPKAEMYQAGPTCSACPKNSCCGGSCQQHGITAKYPGLCKVIDPTTSPEGPGPHGGTYKLYCDFNNQADCAMSFTGKEWNVVKTAGGNFLSIVLNGGENTKFTMDKKFPTEGLFCVKLVIRKAPNVDGEADSGEGAGVMDYGWGKMTFKSDFSFIIPKELRQGFTPMTYGFDAGNTNIQYSYEYSVPAGAPPQFIEIREISAYDGACRR